MPPLSPSDHFILRKLVAEGTLTVDQAEELVQMLEIHRAKDPKAVIPDLLIQRRLLSPSEVNRLLWEAEKQAPSRATAAATHAPHAPPTARTRAGGKNNPRIRIVRHSSMNPVVTITIFLVLITAGLAVFLVLRKKAENEQSLAKEATVTDAADAGLADAKPEPGSGAAPDGALVQAQREELRQVLAARTARAVLDGLSRLRQEVAAGPLHDEIDRAFAKEFERASKLAKEERDRLDGERRELLMNGDLRTALVRSDEILDRYGERVLDGQLLIDRDAVARRVEERCRADLRAGQQAFESGKLDDAQRIFRALVLLAHGSQRQSAEEWLTKIENASKSGSHAGAELATAAKQSSAEKAQPAEQITEAAAKETLQPAADAAALQAARIRAVAERLEELLHGGSNTLGEDGILTCSFYFSAKRLDDVGDWTPTVSDVLDLKANMRWTVHREEEWHASGLHLSNDGYFLHKAVLKPPVSIEMTYYSQNTFQAANFVGAAWVAEKGKGVAGVYGRQTTFLNGYKQSGNRNPREGVAIVSNSSYNFGIEVAGTRFFATRRSDRSGDGQEVLKDMTSGRCAIVWANTVSGIVQSVNISGMLDLDWAEKELGIAK